MRNLVAPQPKKSLRVTSLSIYYEIVLIYQSHEINSEKHEHTA